MNNFFHKNNENKNKNKTKNVYCSFQSDFYASRCLKRQIREHLNSTKEQVCRLQQNAETFHLAFSFLLMKVTMLNTFFGGNFFNENLRKLKVNKLKLDIFWFQKFVTVSLLGIRNGELSNKTLKCKFEQITKCKRIFGFCFKLFGEFTFDLFCWHCRTGKKNLDNE